jgi:hypothetical protein
MLILGTLHYREVQCLPSKKLCRNRYEIVYARRSDFVETVQESFSQVAHYTLVR